MIFSLQVLLTFYLERPQRWSCSIRSSQQGTEIQYRAASSRGRPQGGRCSRSMGSNGSQSKASIEQHSFGSVSLLFFSDLYIPTHMYMLSDSRFVSFFTMNLIMSTTQDLLANEKPSNIGHLYMHWDLGIRSIRMAMKSFQSKGSILVLIFSFLSMQTRTNFRRGFTPFF